MTPRHDRARNVMITPVISIMCHVRLRNALGLEVHYWSTNNFLCMHRKFRTLAQCVMTVPIIRKRPIAIRVLPIMRKITCHDRINNAIFADSCPYRDTITVCVIEALSPNHAYSNFVTIAPIMVLGLIFQ